MPTSLQHAHLLSTYMAETMVEKQAEQVLIIDLQGISDRVTDYFVLATGTSNRHVLALSTHLEEYARKEYKEKPYQVEGLVQAEWVLMDYIHVVVHIFVAETRERYNLEALWGDAEFKYFDKNASIETK